MKQADISDQTNHLTAQLTVQHGFEKTTVGKDDGFLSHRDLRRDYEALNGRRESPGPYWGSPRDRVEVEWSQEIEFFL